MDALQGAIDVDTNIFFSINRMHNMYFRGHKTKRLNYE